MATKVYCRMKRLMDILLCLVGLLLCLPIFLFIFIFIKWEDKHSAVIFSQIRVGENGKQFKMYKFRTMIPDAEAQLAPLLQYNEVQGHMFKMKNDPRITKTGKFLRKSSLDELPQLVNVLRGEMSLVGPRPPLVTEFEKYNELEKKRLNVLPGCTGLWQVSGRSSLSFSQMLSLDLEYIENRSIWLDIKILARTAVEVVKRKNAY